MERRSIVNLLRIVLSTMTGRSSEMVCDSLDRALPPLPLCPGYTLRTFQDGDEDAW